MKEEVFSEEGVLKIPIMWFGWQNKFSSQTNNFIQSRILN